MGRPLSDEDRRAVEERNARIERQRAEKQEREEQAHRATLLKSILNDLGPRFGPDRCSLDNYRVRHPECGQQQVLDAIRALAARLPESIAAGENLILAGTIGTGKD